MHRQMIEIRQTQACPNFLGDSHFEEKFRIYQPEGLLILAFLNLLTTRFGEPFGSSKNVPKSIGNIRGP